MKSMVLSQETFIGKSHARSRTCASGFIKSAPASQSEAAKQMSAMHVERVHPFTVSTEKASKLKGGEPKEVPNESKANQE